MGPEEIMGVAAIVDLFSSAFSLCLNIATYVLTALGLYTIARRRGIDKPWLAWIPVASAWTLGCISDQYRYVVKGETKSKRKILIGLNIAAAAITLVIFIFFGVMIFDVASLAAMDPSESEIVSAMLGSLGGMLLALIPLMGVSIAYAIISYMALYDVYNSCDPKNSVAFLVLSILISITQPFFIFFSRKKDFGMPPRRQDPMGYIPPQQSWQNPQPNQWQQPQQGWQNPQPNQWQQPQQNWQEPRNSGDPENF